MVRAFLEDLPALVAIVLFTGTGYLLLSILGGNF